MSKQTLIGFRFGLVLSVALAVAGCGPRDLPKQETYPVRGKVMWHGEPVRFAIINLEPVDGSGGAHAEGTTAEDGTFALRTLANEGEPDGAVPGQYKVVLEPHDPVRAGALPKGAVATKIPGEMQTGVTVEVKAQENDLSIEVP
jgi:hypothetical protein